MKKYYASFVIVTLVVSVFACTHKPYGISSTAPVNTQDTTHHADTTHTTDVVDTSVCFERDILPIFLGSCAMSGCHDAATAKKGYILTSYAGILAKGVIPGNAGTSKIYTECTSKKMPKSPVPALDSTKLSLLARWINKGATNDTDCPVNCDTSKYTYSGAIVPLLNTYCYSCHASASAPSQGGGITLDNYASLVIQVNNRKLLGDVQRLAGYNFMPQGQAKLSDCKITQISKWIAAGAPNN